MRLRSSLGKFVNSLRAEHCLKSLTSMPSVLALCLVWRVQKLVELVNMKSECHPKHKYVVWSWDFCVQNICVLILALALLWITP